MNYVSQDAGRRSLSLRLETEHSSRKHVLSGSGWLKRANDRPTSPRLGRLRGGPSTLASTGTLGVVGLLSVIAPETAARENLPCQCLRSRTQRPPRGVNVVPFLELIGLPHSIVDILKNSQSGNALTAYALFKIATPARYTVTLGGTSITVKYLRSHGYMSTPPPVKEYLQDRMEETKELITEKMGETKDRLTEKLQETKEKVSFKKKVE
ncbi:protein FAM210A isoform X2 [Sminthopsis crassicaudata]|uniref:protein FAM210A isoform X2 n=1 Tax=Sminthopsis crassicaudata TaxID=9301 RepID=UPI003D68A158